MGTPTTNEAMAPACSDSQALQEKYRKLLRDFQTFQIELKTITNGDSSIAQASSNLNSRIDGIGEFIRSQLHPMYFNEVRADDSTIAQRVFDIQEILELILVQADFSSILAMSQVNKDIRGKIEGSSRQLQLKRYLVPETDSQAQPIM